MDTFRKIEQHFNKSYLLVLYQIRSIVADEQAEKDVQQFQLLDEAYSEWYKQLQDDPFSLQACTYFYEAVKDNHELLMKRDTQLFTIQGDFFSLIFNKPGLNTPHLFDWLSDGRETGKEEDDAKDNMWTSIISLYRLCVIIIIYGKNKMVKQIVDMILSSNPDLTQSNVLEKIVREFKTKKEMRKMIMKALKSNDNSFTEIFTSLSKVIATFSSEVAIDQKMKANIDLAKQKLRSLFDDLLTQAGVKNLKTTEKENLLNALEDKDENRLEEILESKQISSEQMKYIRKQFKAKGLDTMNVTKVVKDLGSTMDSILKAIEKNDEQAVKNILSTAGSGLNMDNEEMEKMQREMEEFEKEVENDENDEDEDEDEEDDDVKKT